MAHFGEKSPFRAYRTSVYGSLAVLAFSSKLHSCVKLQSPRCVIISARGVIADEKKEF